MSEFKKVEIVLKVALLPASTKYPIDDVKRQLNSMLFKYNEEVEGIPLSFSQLKFPRGKEYGRIIAEQFWLHVDVTTKLLVFKPEIGMTLEGVINKVNLLERCEIYMDFYQQKSLIRESSLSLSDFGQSRVTSNTCNVQCEHIGRANE